MKEFIDKIIEKLEEERQQAEKDISLSDTYDEANRCGGKEEAYEKARNIINQLAEEYNDGWILCSERMPDEHDSVFAKFYATNKWNDAMFKKISDTVNVTVIDEKGKGVTTQARTTDGKWSCELLKCNKLYRIIAWQPLPPPYKGGE